MSFGKCRVCGCDDYHACVTSKGPCFWVEDDLCSACFELLRRHHSLSEEDLKKDIRRARKEGVSAETVIRRDAKAAHPKGRIYKDIRKMPP